MADLREYLSIPYVTHVRQINEVQFFGVTFPAWLNGNCPITVTVAPLSGLDTLTGSSSTAASAFQYSTALTPSIASVSPSFGSSLGGTTLTITGSGFGVAADLRVASVVVNGMNCTVRSWSASVVTCVTGQRPPPPNIPQNALSLYSNGSRGFAVMPAGKQYWFRYLDR